MKTTTRLAGVTGVATVAAAAAALFLGTGSGHADPPAVSHAAGPGKITSTLTDVPSELSGCYSHVLGGGLSADGIKSPAVDPDATGKATLVATPLQPGTYNVYVFCAWAGHTEEATLDETLDFVVTAGPSTTTPTTTQPNPWGSLGSLGTGSLAG